MAGVFPEHEEAVRLAVGPESITWRRAGDMRTMFGAGAALLLQVAHPTVAAGVREHSDFKADPWGRLWRTLDYVHMLVYGGPENAMSTGRAMRAMHQRIKGVAPDGRRYHALEPEAYAWVHATLAATIVGSHERFGRPLTPDQRARFWDEWRGLGRLLGIREGDLPETWAAFRAYVDEMCATHARALRCRRRRARVARRAQAARRARPGAAGVEGDHAADLAHDAPRDDRPAAPTPRDAPWTSSGPGRTSSSSTRSGASRAPRPP